MERTWACVLLNLASYAMVDEKATQNPGPPVFWLTERSKQYHVLSLKPFCAPLKPNQYKWGTSGLWVGINSAFCIGWHRLMRLQFGKDTCWVCQNFARVEPPSPGSLSGPAPVDNSVCSFYRSSTSVWTLCCTRQWTCISVARCVTSSATGSRIRTHPTTTSTPGTTASQPPPCWWQGTSPLLCERKLFVETLSKTLTHQLTVFCV